MSMNGAPNPTIRARDTPRGAIFALAAADTISGRACYLITGIAQAAGCRGTVGTILQARSEVKCSDIVEGRMFNSLKNQSGLVFIGAVCLGLVTSAYARLTGQQCEGVMVFSTLPEVLECINPCDSSGCQGTSTTCPDGSGNEGVRCKCYEQQLTPCCHLVMCFDPEGPRYPKSWGLCGMPFCPQGECHHYLDAPNSNHRAECDDGDQ